MNIRSIARSLAGFLAIVFATTCGLVSSHAEDNRAGIAWLTGETIRTTFSGQPVGGLYPNGRLWSEAIGTDSTTDYREGDKHWRGEWWVTDREFCFAYPPPGLGGCFRVTQVSANCYELYDFSSDAAKAEEPPNIADLWNGRMWLSTKPTTCEERPNS